MYQDILPHRYVNAYHPVSPVHDDIIFGYDGSNFLLKNDQTFYRYQDLDPTKNYIYLFQIDDTHFYMSDLSYRKDYSSLSVFTLRTFQPKHLAFACITGWHIYQWMRINQYCGRCGHKMIPYQKERAMYCPHCGNLVYPKIQPAVIVGVLNEKHQILLTKYAHGNYQKYALVAGFNEIGETIEETAIREVHEETGLDIHDLVYYKSQPWAFSSSLLMGFWARADSHQPIALTDGELKTAVWKDRDVNVDDLDESSLTAEMIRFYKKGSIE